MAPASTMQQTVFITGETSSNITHTLPQSGLISGHPTLHATSKLTYLGQLHYMKYQTKLIHILWVHMTDQMPIFGPDALLDSLPDVQPLA